jgi:hypothetical protein
VYLVCEPTAVLYVDILFNVTNMESDVDVAPASMIPVDALSVGPAIVVAPVIAPELVTDAPTMVPLHEILAALRSVVALTVGEEVNVLPLKVGARMTAPTPVVVMPPVTLILAPLKIVEALTVGEEVRADALRVGARMTAPTPVVVIPPVTLMLAPLKIVEALIVGACDRVLALNVGPEMTAPTPDVEMDPVTLMSTPLNTVVALNVLAVIPRADTLPAGTEMLPPEQTMEYVDVRFPANTVDADAYPVHVMPLAETVDADMVL